MTDSITKSEIKKKLCRHYGANVDRRKMIETKVRNCYDKIGTILYSINGSPPKGYGLYTPTRRHLSLYDLSGKRFRILRDYKVIE